MTRTVLGRRQFLASSSFLLLGAGCRDAPQVASQTPPKGVNVREDLTPAEVELVNHSTMAKDLDNFFGKRYYNCAESGLLVGLRFLKKPEELVWVARGFGGGLGQGDLCGFLTAGVMVIDLYAGTLGLDRKGATQVCSQKTREYWTWWASTAPLHCAEIRGGYTDFRYCPRLGKLAAVELERLIGSRSRPA
ncbi:MAG: C-GCAxxG-C-C family (seleno)protein [Planctomycetota bacterium]